MSNKIIDHIITKSIKEGPVTTNDNVYIFARDDVHIYTNPKEIRGTATDYAIMCGAHLSHGRWGYKNKEGTYKLLRSAVQNYIEVVTPDAWFGSVEPNYSTACFFPVLNVDFDYFNSPSILSSVDIDAKMEHNSTEYHTARIGLEFPKRHVKDDLSKVLDELKSSGKLMRTGASYTGFMRKDGKLVNNPEYEYNGERYVNVEVCRCYRGIEFEDGALCPENGKFCWAKVEPIVFRIKNWSCMPKNINPFGDGTAQYVQLEADEGILAGLPFFPKGTTQSSLLSDQTSQMVMWQNSLLRAWLNGYDLFKEIENGNGDEKFRALKNFRFEGKGFLYEATQHLAQSSTNQYSAQSSTNFASQGKNTETKKKQKPNPYGFTFDDLSNDDLIRLYVRSDAAIFLHGPSGVGKSDRVKQIDPTATRITLRPQMNPEEIDGTLDRETGEYIQPLWYKQLCEKCKAEPNRKHVLFIDELTNVKPTVQSLVYSIVLDRAGKDGLWPLPENSVVIAAGNETANNLAANPLTNALFRRFSHIYYDVDRNAWLDWATGISSIQKQEYIKKDDTPKAKIHPAIVAYMMSRNEDILYQDLDEENPHIVTDPRKWEIASNVLYSTKNPRALKPAIGEELTEDFTAFVKSINISVEDIVNGDYDKEDFAEMNISQKLSTLVGLCVASEKELPKVRKFISQNLGKEILATYDALWIQNDPERAQIIATSPLNDEKEEGRPYENE